MKKGVEKYTYIVSQKPIKRNFHIAGLIDNTGFQPSCQKMGNVICHFSYAKFSIKQNNEITLISIISGSPK